MHAVLQATPFAERGKVTLQLPSCRRGTQLSTSNKMLVSAKYVTYMYSMTMDAICEEHGSDWSNQVSVVATAR